MHSALWIIPILPFVLAFFTTWSFNEAIAETVWFNVTYVASLGIIFALELAGFGIVSTSPTGLGGFFALLFAFIALGIRRYQYKQEQRRKAAAKAAAIAEAERQRRKAGARQPEERSLIVDAFRFAAEVKKSRSNPKR
jgi:flagellar biosynthesis component FlhA